ncbi:MAG: glucokinase [Crocosphaera sp.]|nr:glucokinase [Crocosphaera sp.]
MANSSTIDITKKIVNGIKSFLDFSKVVDEERGNWTELENWLKDTKIDGQNIETLLNILNSSGVKIGSAALPFVPLLLEILNICLKRMKRELTLAECISLVSQSAYLDSLEDMIEFIKEQKNNDILSKEEVQVLEAVQDINYQSLLRKQQSNLETVSCKSSEEEAKQAVLYFRESFWAESLNKSLKNLILDKLSNNNTRRLKTEEVTVTDILVRRVAANTYKFMRKALEQAGDKVKILANLYDDNQREALELEDDISRYLQEKIVDKITKEPIFKYEPSTDPNVPKQDFEFTLKQLYVSLKGKIIDTLENTKKINKEPLYLEKWAKEKLLDEQDKVLLIEGAAGRGKSVFCKMFAYYVYQHLYPLWIPIIIRLQDIEFRPGNLLGYELQRRVEEYVCSRPDEEASNIRFLFLLDGFDELLSGKSTGPGIYKFIEQISNYKDTKFLQKDRILLTGRTNALSPYQQLPEQESFERIEICPMDKKAQNDWLKKWEALVTHDWGQTYLPFDNFLENCPKSVKKLAKEPLLILMLAIMYQKEVIDDESIQEQQVAKAKITIYEESLKWVVHRIYQRIHTRTTYLNEDDLYRILEEAGLSVIQIKDKAARVIDFIQTRLRDDSDLQARFKKARAKIGDDAFRNLFISFYLQKSGRDSELEFSHESFAEFLYAKRLKANMVYWSELTNRQLPLMYNDIYDMLGFGQLTPEILEYLMALLDDAYQGKEINLSLLFEYLEIFYYDWCKWCRGEFDDSDIWEFETNIKQKTKQLNDYSQNLKMGERQLNIYVGLNILILLFEFHRRAKDPYDWGEEISFHPCPIEKDMITRQTGQETLPPRRKTQLLEIINYVNSFEKVDFVSIVGQFLNGVDLSYVDLSGTELQNADFSNSNLHSANLSRANLSGANFFEADLSDAVLRHANLHGADLSGAYIYNGELNGAYLRLATLENVNLSGAFLRDADLSGTELNRAYLGGANLRNSNLVDANLINTVLSGVCLNNADLRGINLEEASLYGANCSGADFSDTNSRLSKLTNAKLCGALFKDTNLRGADLSGANVAYTDFSYSNLSCVNLEGIEEHEKAIWEGIRGLETISNLSGEVQESIQNPRQKLTSPFPENNNQPGRGDDHQNLVDKTILTGYVGVSRTILSLVKIPSGKTLLSSTPLPVLHEDRYPSRDYNHLSQIIKRFLQEAKPIVHRIWPDNQLSLTQACFGIAGPIFNSACKLSNHSWPEITVKDLQNDLKREFENHNLTNVKLLNDFEAIGYGISRSRWYILQPGIQQENQQQDVPIAVLGAASGLGETLLMIKMINKNKQIVEVYPTEGGHIDFAPQDDLEFELSEHLENQHSRVSVDRLLSGSGIVEIYEFLYCKNEIKKEKTTQKVYKQVKLWQEQQENTPHNTVDPATIIAEAATKRNKEDQDPIAVQTMKLFMKIYGTEAGNFALRCFPEKKGYVYIAGAIASRNLLLFEQGDFLQAFNQRMSTNIPVYILLDPRAGLIGAAVGANSHLAPRKVDRGKDV